VVATYSPLCCKPVSVPSRRYAAFAGLLHACRVQYFAPSSAARAYENEVTPVPERFALDMLAY
jgi:hypothetical protein